MLQRRASSGALRQARREQQPLEAGWPSTTLCHQPAPGWSHEVCLPVIYSTGNETGGVWGIALTASFVLEPCQVPGPGGDDSLANTYSYYCNGPLLGKAVHTPVNLFLEITLQPLELSVCEKPERELAQRRWVKKLKQFKKLSNSTMAES